MIWLTVLLSLSHPAWALPCGVRCNSPALRACKDQWHGEVIRLRDHELVALLNRQSELPSLIERCDLAREEAHERAKEAASTLGILLGRIEASEADRESVEATIRLGSDQARQLESVRTLFDETLPELLLEVQTYLEGQSEALSQAIARIQRQLDRTSSSDQVRVVLELEIAAITELAIRSNLDPISPLAASILGLARQSEPSRLTH